MAEFIRRKGCGDKAERTVRFRVASARSGRVLREVFREDASSGSESVESDTSTCSSEPERSVSPVTSEANGHLSGLGCMDPDDSGSDQDDLLMYAASAAQEELFTGKRINIFSKNGTVRGVRDKVSAGQVLFNNLSKIYVVSPVANSVFGTLTLKMMEAYSFINSGQPENSGQPHKPGQQLTVCYAAMTNTVSQTSHAPYGILCWKCKLQFLHNEGLESYSFY